MLRRFFTEHPASVGESYFGHFFQAAGFAARMAVGAGACLVHAIVPGLCKHTGSRIISDMNAKLSHRRDIARSDLTRQAAE